jgi:uncharacterized protein (DUF488 family)
MDAFDLFTIGHSNHPIDAFVGLLRDAGITALADVRSVPFSRRYPWFSQPALSQRLSQEGIALVPLGDALGGRPGDRGFYRDDGVPDYTALTRTPAFHSGIERVIAGTRKLRVCLMCAEREPLDCHRCLLLAPAFTARGLRLGHILADGSIESHAATEARLLAEGRADADDLFEDARRRVEVAYRARMQARLARRNRLASNP